MKKVMIFSVLLILGLIGSQLLPGLAGENYRTWYEWINAATLIGLSFIMIHVGYEFEIDKTKLRSYGWDYVVAMTAAAFPWIFVSLYFAVVMLPPDVRWGWDAWKEILIAARFAAPTSAGVLFSMLAAAGLSATWLFRKARILAIFDDLDTVLLMIPLSMLIVGPAWQLLAIVVLMGIMLRISWRHLHAVEIPISWPWVMGYSVLIVAISEAIYLSSKWFNEQVPIHIEVLLPAFVLGTIMKRPGGADPHCNDTEEGCLEGPESPGEQLVSTIVSSIFIFFVGMSMPPIFGEAATAKAADTVTGSQPMIGMGTIILHVIAITVISNLGKMFPAFCYRKEAHWKERLAVSIGMWPRGEVGAGILIISIGYGLGGPVITVAALSLALNLLLTGAFIWIVKKLLKSIR